MLGGGGGHTFRDMGGAFSRYGRRCRCVRGVEGVIHTVGVLFIACFSERYDVFDAFYLFTRIR